MLVSRLKRQLSNIFVVWLFVSSLCFAAVTPVLAEEFEDAKSWSGLSAVYVKNNDKGTGFEFSESSKDSEVLLAKAVDRVSKEDRSLSLFKPVNDVRSVKFQLDVPEQEYDEGWPVETDHGAYILINKEELSKLVRNDPEGRQRDGSTNLSLRDYYLRSSDAEGNILSNGEWYRIEVDDCRKKELVFEQFSVPAEGVRYWTRGDVQSIQLTDRPMFIRKTNIEPGAIQVEFDHPVNHEGQRVKVSKSWLISEGFDLTLDPQFVLGDSNPWQPIRYTQDDDFYYLHPPHFSMIGIHQSTSGETMGGFREIDDAMFLNALHDQREDVLGDVIGTADCTSLRIDRIAKDKLIAVWLYSGDLYARVIQFDVNDEYPGDISYTMGDPEYIADAQTLSGSFSLVDLSVNGLLNQYSDAYAIVTWFERELTGHSVSPNGYHRLYATSLKIPSGTNDVEVETEKFFIYEWGGQSYTSGYGHRSYLRHSFARTASADSVAFSAAGYRRWRNGVHYEYDQLIGINYIINKDGSNDGYVYEWDKPDTTNVHVRPPVPINLGASSSATRVFFTMFMEWTNQYNADYYRDHNRVLRASDGTSMWSKTYNWFIPDDDDFWDNYPYVEPWIRSWETSANMVPLLPTSTGGQIYTGNAHGSVHLMNGIGTFSNDALISVEGAGSSGTAKESIVVIDQYIDWDNYQDGFYMLFAGRAGEYVASTDTVYRYNEYNEFADPEEYAVAGDEVIVAVDEDRYIFPITIGMGAGNVSITRASGIFETDEVTATSEIEISDDAVLWIPVGSATKGIMNFTDNNNPEMEYTEVLTKQALSSFGDFYYDQSEPAVYVYLGSVEPGDSFSYSINLTQESEFYVNPPNYLRSGDNFATRGLITDADGKPVSDVVATTNIRGPGYRDESYYINNESVDFSASQISEDWEFEDSYHIEGFGLSSRPVSYYPWLYPDQTSFSYLKEITVSNKMAGYQTRINVTNNSGGDVTCGGNVKSDFRDIRFTDSEGNTSPYWIEEKVDGDYAIIWVNNIWNDSTLKMYYGNDAASCNSSSSDTFPTYFDDWITNNTDDWQKYGRGSGSNVYEHIHKTVDADFEKRLYIDGVFSDWEYGKWDYSWIGFSDDKNTKLMSCDNAVWVRLWHRTNSVDDTDNLWFSLYSRKDGSQSNTDQFGISTDYISDDLIIELLFTDTTMNFSIREPDGTTVVSEELSTNIPKSSDVGFFSWGGLDIAGMPQSFLDPGYRISNGLGENGGFSLDINTWFIGKYNEDQQSFSFSSQETNKKTNTFFPQRKRKAIILDSESTYPSGGIVEMIVEYDPWMAWNFSDLVFVDLEGLNVYEHEFVEINEGINATVKVDVEVAISTGEQLIAYMYFDYEESGEYDSVGLGSALSDVSYQFTARESFYKSDHDSEKIPLKLEEGYGKELSIGNAEEGAVIQITVGYTEGDALVHCNAKANDNFSDVRFYSNKEKEEIPFFLGDVLEGSHGEFYVNNTYGDTTLIMTYGSGENTSASNGNETFLFFDDFSTSASSSLWNSSDYGESPIDLGEEAAVFETGDSNNKALRTYEEFDMPIKVSSKWNHSRDDADMDSFISFNCKYFHNAQGGFWNDDIVVYDFNNAVVSIGSDTNQTSSLGIDTTNPFLSLVKFTSSRISTTTSLWDSWHDKTGTASSTSGYIGVGADINSDGTVHLHWVGVHKHTEDEQTVDSVREEVEFQPEENWPANTGYANTTIYYLDAFHERAIIEYIEYEATALTGNGSIEYLFSFDEGESWESSSSYTGSHIAPALSSSVMVLLKISSSEYTGAGYTPYIEALDLTVHAREYMVDNTVLLSSKWNCSNGNYEVDISTTALIPGTYSWEIYFWDFQSDVTFKRAGPLYLDVFPPGGGGGQGAGPYHTANLYYSSFDLNTGTGLNDNFFQFYISSTPSFNEGNRVKGGRYYTYLGQTLYFKIEDFFGNRIYPSNASYEEVLIDEAETYVDCGINLRQFRVKNQNHSTIYFIIRDPETDLQVGRWIPPYEEAEFFLLDNTYNLTIQYYNSATAALEKTVYDDAFVIDSDTFFWIEGHSLADIVIDIYNVNATILDQIINIGVNINNDGSNIINQVLNSNTLLKNIDSNVSLQNINMMAEINNINTSIIQQVNSVWAAVNNTNTTITDQANLIKQTIENTESNITNQVSGVMQNVSNVNSTVVNQANLILQEILNQRMNITNQVNSVWQTINNSDNTEIMNQLNIVNQTIDNINTNITTQANLIKQDIFNMNNSIDVQLNSLSQRIINLNGTIDTQLNTLSQNVTNMNNTVHTQLNAMNQRIINMNNSVDAQLNSISGSIFNMNTSLHQQTTIISADINNVNSNINTSVNIISNKLTNVETNITTQQNYIIANISSINSTLNQVNTVSLEIYNNQSNITDQINTVLFQLINENGAIENQTNIILNQFSNINSNITNMNQTITVAISNINNNISSMNQTVVQLIANVNNSMASFEQNIESIIVQQNQNISTMNQTISYTLAQVNDNVTNMKQEITQQIAQQNTNITHMNNTIVQTTGQINTNIQTLSQDVSQWIIQQNTNISEFKQHISQMVTSQNTNISEMQSGITQLLGINISHVNNLTMNQTQIIATITENITNMQSNINQIILQQNQNISTMNQTISYTLAQVNDNVTNMKQEITQQIAQQNTNITHMNNTIVQTTGQINTNIQTLSQDVSQWIIQQNSNITSFRENVSIWFQQQANNIDELNTSINTLVGMNLSGLNNATINLTQQTAVLLDNISTLETNIQQILVQQNNNISSMNQTITTQLAQVNDDVTSMEQTFTQQINQQNQNISSVNQTIIQYTGQINTNINSLNQDISQWITQQNSNASSLRQNISSWISQQNTNISGINQTLVQMMTTQNSNIGYINSTVSQMHISINENITAMNQTLISKVTVMNSNITTLSQDLSNYFLSQNMNISDLSQNLTSFFGTINTNVENMNQTLVALITLQNQNISNIYNQGTNIMTAVNNANTTIHDQTTNILTLTMTINSTVHNKTETIMNLINCTNQTVANKAIEIMESVMANNTMVFNRVGSAIDQMVESESNLSDDIVLSTLNIIENVTTRNDQIFDKTINILENLTALNMSINVNFSEIESIVNSISGKNDEIFNKTIAILENISSINISINETWFNNQFESIESIINAVSNKNDEIFNKTLDVIAELTAINISINNSIFNRAAHIINQVTTETDAIFNKTLRILENMTDLNMSGISQVLEAIENITSFQQQLDANISSIVSRVDVVSSKVDGALDDILQAIDDINITGYNNMMSLLQGILEQFELPHEWMLPQVNYSINDSTPPVSVIRASNALGGGINVHWSSTDNHPLGVSYVTIQYKIENASTWKVWKAAAIPIGSEKFTSEVEPLKNGSVYYFKCIGVDAAGNVEADSDSNMINITYVYREIPSSPIQEAGVMMRGIMTDMYFWIAVAGLLALFGLLGLYRRGKQKKIMRQTDPRDLSMEEVY